MNDTSRNTTTYPKPFKGVERDIARAALSDPNVTRLMTIPGVDVVVAVGLMAAIGRIERFDSPDKLVAYIVSIRASISLVMDQPIMAGSPSADAQTPVIYWSRRPGRQFAVPDLFAPSTNGFELNAAITLRRLRLPASWR